MILIIPIRRPRLVSAFSHALQHNAPVVLRFCREYVEKNRTGIKTAQAEFNRIQKMLEARRKKVSLKTRKGKKKAEPDAINLFHAVIEKELEHVKDSLLKMERDLEVCDKAEEELDRYESNEEEPKQRIMMAYGFDISAGL